jgi:hypothetical protein
MRKGLRLLLVLAALTVVLAAGAGSASADYGQGAVYQVEITANIGGPQGGGIWLWLALTPDHPGATYGTADYTGSDCGHGGGAIKDMGEASWTDNGNGTISISPVDLVGLEQAFAIGATTITVPSAYGHYSYSPADDPLHTIFNNVPGFLPPGKAQVQIAP